MDSFYEESAVNANPKKEAQKYQILHIISRICLVIGIILLVLCFFNMPFGGSGSASKDVILLKIFSIFTGAAAALFLAVWFILSKCKARFSISYDYCFVSGELRISKVININKRKLVTLIDSQEILQIGDTDNSSYARLKGDPSIKEVICTPNKVPAEGKFFMYILANVQGRQLYILECREALLMNIMKYTRRTALESDYVMQDRKQK